MGGKRQRFRRWWHAWRFDLDGCLIWLFYVLVIVSLFFLALRTVGQALRPLPQGSLDALPPRPYAPRT